MFNREIKSELTRLMSQYSVVTLTGPRQSGKTTLVREAYPNKPYFNLENPDTLNLIKDDPRAFFSRSAEGAILDEIQNAPELISYIQNIVDEAQTTGMFILTGSQQLQLHQAITQSLAGRTALLDLLPLTIHELKTNHIELSIDEYLLNGFYPAIYQKKLDPTTHYRNYVKTYIERDVRNLTNIHDLVSFQRFIQLSAGRIGSVLNVESLANDVGVSHNTIKNWFSILEASWLLIRLQPYFENFGKRIIKSPKIYFTDVGIISYLLGIENTTQIARDRLRGHLFENLVLLELMKEKLNRGKDPHLFYYRDHHHNEVDIIIQYRDFIIPVEIKATATYSSALLKNLKYFKDLAGQRVPTGFLIYAGDYENRVGDFHLINYQNTRNIYSMIEKD